MLMREMSRERGLGVIHYEWMNVIPNKLTFMVPLPRGIDIESEEDENGNKHEFRIAPGYETINAHASPDGTIISCVRDNELYVFNLLNFKTVRSTFGAAGEQHLTHGLAEYIAQEEMGLKNGYWWSLDSKFIVFTQTDTFEMPLFSTRHQKIDFVGSKEENSYPFAGGRNATVRLGVISAGGGPLTWMDLVCGETSNEEYLARVNWMHDNILIAQVLNRSHTKLKVIKFDINIGGRTVLLEEEHETWMNLHDCFAPIHKIRGFIWASEKSGFKHLYLHDFNGVCLGQITEGDCMVEQVCGVHEENDAVYFTGTLDGFLECHLYRTKFFPDDHNPLQVPLRLTRKGEAHDRTQSSVVIFCRYPRLFRFVPKNKLLGGWNLHCNLILSSRLYSSQNK